MSRPRHPSRIGVEGTLDNMSNQRGPLNSSAIPEAQPVAGVFNASPPAPLDGQGCALQLDANGNLKVATQGGGVASIVQIEDSTGNALNSNGTGALNVAVVSGGGSNASVGVTGSTAPTSATEIGVVVGGNLQNVSAANPLPENVAQWGGTSVTAAATTAPVGTEASPVTRPIQRKSTTILTTANLGNGAAFTSSWVDTNQTGESFITVTVFANQVSATNGFVIQESDDSTDSNMTNPITRFSVAASTLSSIQGLIRMRFWRVIYTNGSTPTTVIKITATSCSNSPIVSIGGNDVNGNLIPLAMGSATATVTTYGGMFVAAGLPVVAGGAVVGADGGAGAIPIIEISGAAAGSLATTSYAVTAGAGSSTSLSALRSPSIFKTVQATASGNTTVWTPTSGKKFRLLKLFVEVTDNASLASGAVLTINFQDATTSINISFDVFVPTTAVTTVVGDGLEQELDLGNFGILSAAANNVLNVNLSAALATGNCRVIAMGTEE
jgi:hypothetical protein